MSCALYFKFLVLICVFWGKSFSQCISHFSAHENFSGPLKANLQKAIFFPRRNVITESDKAEK